MEAEHITAIWSRKFKDLLSRMISLIQKQQNNKNIHKYIQKINILDITIINLLLINVFLLDRKEIKEDVKRMEYFLTICGVLNEYLSDEILPNAVELLGIYGRVC